jgi:GT2 family glycosyltransferase
MISIVMTFYQRHKQLLKTLDSFRDYKDFNVVIVDDNSPDDIKLGNYPFEVHILKLSQKNWINPAPVFNFGFNYAIKLKSDIIVLQNAECYHVGDILSAVRDHLTDKNYLSFAAYSLGKDQDIDFRAFNMKGAVSNGDSAWYNHSIYRPEAFHFCCAITTENLRKLNGFDERFAPMLGWEDNYFIHQIRTLGLKINIIDNPFVLHQYHYDVKAFTFDAGLYYNTKNYCDALKRDKQYRAFHTITPDL